MSAELEIPDAAVEAVHAVDADLPDDAARWHAGAIVAPVVADELRRFADEIAKGCEDYIANGWSDERRVAARRIANRLRARADKLDGGVK